MELLKTTTKQGFSEIGDFKLTYSVLYDEEGKAIKVDAQIKRKATDTIAEIYIGIASYAEKRYNFSLTTSATTDERKSLIDEFETTIAELGL